MPMPDMPPAVALPHVAAEFEAAAGGTPGARVLVRRRCAAGRPGEIVVCAGDPQRNRLAALPATGAEDMPKAEARLSERVTLDVHTETAQISGVPSHRAMVGLKVGF